MGPFDSSSSVIHYRTIISPNASSACTHPPLRENGLLPSMGRPAGVCRRDLPSAPGEARFRKAATRVWRRVVGNRTATCRHHGRLLLRGSEGHTSERPRRCTPAGRPMGGSNGFSSQGPAGVTRRGRRGSLLGLGRELRRRGPLPRAGKSPFGRARAPHRRIR